MPQPAVQNRYYKTNFTKKTYTQTVSIALGCLMIVIGLAGILNPEFMGMHLSAMHSLVLVGAACLCIWAATQAPLSRAFQVNILLAIFFALNCFAGFLLGEPGHPSVGYDAPDDLLLRLAPGFLELGTVDHFVHGFLALFFITGAWSYRKHHRQSLRRKRS